VSGVRLSVLDPALAARTGRGVRIAVVDSGIASGHPHVGIVTGGLRIGRNGEEDNDWGDRIGHGTAVAAAIREKAPEAELLAFRVFERELSTTADALSVAIRRAADHGAQLINLSLGTVNPAHVDHLSRAVEYASERGALVVSARELDGTPWLPGALAGVMGVRLDWDCPRDEIHLTQDDAGGVVAIASGYPRPIPGMPPDRNLKGISFAVANVTGVLGRGMGHTS